MKCQTWIPLGSLFLLLCAHQGDGTLILGSMLMAATAAMTGGLIMGPLTIGGLVMMMMMANQNAQQRTASSTTSTNLGSTLENSQNLLNLLSTLTGAASNLATSASNQASLSATPKASKRALYSPQNLEDLLASSSRMTSRQWKSIPETTPQPKETSTFMSNDFWNRPSFSPETGFAVEPIPDDLLEIAMRIPQAKSANMFDFETTTAPPSTTMNNLFSSLMDMSPPQPIASNEQMRFIPSEAGDLFSSFPEAKESDFFNFVRKRSTREVLESTFRLEDIANVTYANEKDPAIREKLNEREKQEELNSRILRQLGSLDPFRCLPQLACTLQATPPSQQSGILNDYAYLMKTVFERDDQDEEEDDEKPAAASAGSSSSSSSKRKTNNNNKGLAQELAALLSATVSGSKKKKLDYKSPSSKGEKNADVEEKLGKGRKKDDDDEEEDELSSEEIPLTDEEIESMLMKEKYDMEQAANEELLNEDPELLPYILKSASKGPSYLGRDDRYNPSLHHTAELAIDKPESFDLDGTVGPSTFDEETGKFARPAPLFSPTQLARFKHEDLSKLSESELNTLLRQVSSYPGEIVQLEDGDDTANGNIADILSSFIPRLPEVSVGFTRRRTTGNTAFDDDPFFDDFNFRKRSLEPAAENQKLTRTRRVVRRAREAGPGGRLAYLRRMKRAITATQDAAQIFQLATEAGAKLKSARQCRFLFNSCPMNATQLLGMIGGIRNAVVNLSNAQQILAGIQTTTTPSPASDVVGTLATIGPNIVKYPANNEAPQPTTNQNPPYPNVHQLQPVQASGQHTVVIPQIIQVPMPISTPQIAPVSQPIIFQQSLPHQSNPHPSSGIKMHPVFNVPTDSASSSQSGVTQISHELPSGEKLEISMKLTGSNSESQSQESSGSFQIPTSPKAQTKKNTLNSLKQSLAKLPDAPTTYRPTVDLSDLFDDDKSDNFVLPSKALHEPESKPSTTSIDSLQAAILAIKKINNAASAKDQSKSHSLVEDDERDDITPQKKRKPGLRLPIKKHDKENDDDDDEASDSEEEEDEEDGDEYGYRKIPDPLDPKRRELVPVPTKSAQFSSTMTVPATQTFAKKQLQVETTRRPIPNDSGSSEEINISGTTNHNNNRRIITDTSGSSEEEEDRYRQHHHQHRRYGLNRNRRPKILYPQENLEKPLFIPL